MDLSETRGVLYTRYQVDEEVDTGKLPNLIREKVNQVDEKSIKRRTENNESEVTSTYEEYDEEYVLHSRVDSRSIHATRWMKESSKILGR